MTKDELSKDSKQLEEEKNHLFHLTNQLKEARLSVKRIEDKLKKEIERSSVATSRFREIIFSQRKTIVEYKQGYQDAINRLGACLLDYDLTIKKVEQYSKEREQHLKEKEQLLKEKGQHLKERQQLSKKIKKLEAENNYLRGRINIIKKYKLGRLAIKAYNKYQKFFEKRV